MPTQKLTNKAVECATPIPGKRRILWDSAVSDDTTLPGSFGLRVTSRGVKSWVAMFRVEDERNPGTKNQRFFTLGHYPAISLAEAREIAREALKVAGRGVDPIEAKKAEKREIASTKTVEEAVDLFINRYAKRNNRSWREVERVFNVYVLPKWSDRPLPSISPTDIHSVLDDLIDAGHPYMANRVLAHVRKFFNWCGERNWISDPPTARIVGPGKEEARDRVLDKGEIKRFWDGCDAIGWPFAQCFKLLVVTGQRRDEVARMKWEHLDKDGKLWTLPKQETKSDRRHEVPLSSLALELLGALPRNGDYVFTTTGKTPISGFSVGKKRLDRICEVEGWRLHDLRRTAASGMAEIGVAPHVIEKVLNHATGQISGVAAVYNRHSYLREKRDALDAWARALGAIVSPGEGNVFELRGLE